jgi:hypothetical protein
MNGSNENNPSGNRKDFRILSLDGGGNTRSGDIST